MLSHQIYGDQRNRAVGGQKGRISLHYIWRLHLHGCDEVAIFYQTISQDPWSFSQLESLLLSDIPVSDQDDSAINRGAEPPDDSGKLPQAMLRLYAECIGLTGIVDRHAWVRTQLEVFNVHLARSVLVQTMMKARLCIMQSMLNSLD